MPVPRNALKSTSAVVETRRRDTMPKAASRSLSAKILDFKSLSEVSRI